jgi:hypothetical protein
VIIGTFSKSKVFEKRGIERQLILADLLKMRYNIP